jgi:hypothetical protein
MRFLRTIPAVLIFLSLFAVLQAPATAAPATPSIVAPGKGRVDVSFNPTMEGSAYSGSPGHKATGWQIDGSNDFASPEWTRTSAAPETQTVINATNGTFANDLAGKTQLDMNTSYACRVRYQDTSNTWSVWGSSFFITATTTWYLAEGSTDGGMETWLLIQNPGDTDAHVNVEFQTGQGLVPGPQDQIISPNSRVSFNVGAYVTSYDVSTRVTTTQGTIACERAMYGPGRVWGHDSIGVTAPASTWYLAEGATAGGMETWVLVQNPNATPVKVSLSLQTDEGLKTPARLQEVSIPAASRMTFEIGKYVQTYDVSTRVVSTGGGVICERAMYGNSRQWGSDSIGATAPSFGWYMTEGCTAEGFETWVLVQNPEGYQQEVALLFFDEQGPIDNIPRFILPANSRMTVNVGDYIQSYNVATTVVTWNEVGGIPDKTGKIICERAMYDTSRMWGHDSIGSPYRFYNWTLPEGSTEGGMETWILVQTTDKPANVSLVLMTENGLEMPAELQNINIPAFCRRSFNLGNYVTSYDVSTLVVADYYVVCERSMYGPGREWATNSIGYILGLGSASGTGGASASAGFNAAGTADFDAAAYYNAFLEAARDRENR